MGSNKNRGLGSLYLILAIHVVLIVVLSPLTNAIPPITEVFSFANIFSFDIAPNSFATCDVRSFLFYTDVNGNKRQGDFSFADASLFVTFDIQSRATGATIEEFEVQTRLKCTEDLSKDPSDLNFDLTPTSKIIYSVFATNQDGNEVFIKISTIDPTVPPTGTRQASTMRTIDVQNKEVIIAVFKVSADEIEEKIKPVDSSRRGTTSTASQEFSSQLRIKTDYEFDFDILNVKWEAFGLLDNGYKMKVIDTGFSGTINQPLSTEINIQVVRPTNGVFKEGETRVVSITAKLPQYTSGEGLPTMKIFSEQTGITVATTVMTGNTASSSEATFGSQVVLGSLESGSFKVQVSLPKRTTAQTIIKTFDAGSTGGGTTPNPVCVIDSQFIDLIDPTTCRPDTTCEDFNQITSSVFGFGSFCVPTTFAWVFQGLNILWILVGIIVVIIFLKIIATIAGGGGSKVIVRSAVPTGF